MIILILIDNRLYSEHYRIHLKDSCSLNGDPPYLTLNHGLNWRTPPGLGKCWDITSSSTLSLISGLFYNYLVLTFIDVLVISSTEAS